MAEAPLLQLASISLDPGGKALFRDLDLAIHPGERLALVGRNGSGKSTLLGVMAGRIEPDSGQRALSPGCRIALMEQTPDTSGHETLGAFAARNLPPGEEWRIPAAAQGLKFAPDTPLGSASGGEIRRAALAGVLAAGADLLLLDEPTNHLDIEAIAWLEKRLSDGPEALVVISHDRAFLRAVARSTLWLDRGQVHRSPYGFDRFEAWREKLWAEEDARRHKLERRIRAEARWAVEGISARRKRNQGRLRALEELRRQRREMIAREGTAAFELGGAAQSGRMVIEAQHVSLRLDERQILRDFSIRILRGDRIGIVGPNGAGKTTLLRLLTGEIPPDQGRLRLGTGLRIARFEQDRASLDPDASLWENLTGDEAMRVRGRADQIMVRGTPRNIFGYLRDFLFTEEQARSPVRALSGGEQARLLLARLMARESNLLVLDEPTNDLDMETLDLLQEQLASHEGTVLLVSHDRDFLDRIATMTVLLDGSGKAAIHAGGYSDALRAATAEGDGRQEPAKPRKGQGKGGKSRGKAVKGSGRNSQRTERKKRPQNRLSFTQRHRLEALPDIIARLEQEIARLGDFLSDADLHAREPQKAARAASLLAEKQAELEKAEAEWLLLAERAEAEAQEQAARGGG